MPARGHQEAHCPACLHVLTENFWPNPCPQILAPSMMAQLPPDRTEVSRRVPWGQAVLCRCWRHSALCSFSHFHSSDHPGWVSHFAELPLQGSVPSPRLRPSSLRGPRSVDEMSGSTPGSGDRGGEGGFALPVEGDRGSAVPVQGHQAQPCPAVALPAPPLCSTLTCT